MVKTLANNIFCIKIPLPGTPLKSLNSVVFKGKDRNLVIDTGLNHDECFNAIKAGLIELDIDLNHTDFFLTPFSCRSFWPFAQAYHP